MKKNFVVCVVMAFALVLASCIENDVDNSQNLLREQTAAIDASLVAEGFDDVVRDINGVRMVIKKLGTGFPAKGSSTITVDYVGRLFDNNTIFDQGTIASKPLSGLINGWQIALISLPEGSEATVYIPSYWAYGPSGQGAIPGNAILKFDLAFNKINRTSAELQKLASDTVAIDNYLTKENIVAEKDSTGLRYLITAEGTGPTPTLYDQISYHVVYKLITADSLTAAEYDLSPTSNNYNRVVDQYADGLKLGLQKMRKGGKATFYIPSILGFGANGVKSNSDVIIPPNANLIVDVEVDDILNP